MKWTEPYNRDLNRKSRFSKSDKVRNILDNWDFERFLKDSKFEIFRKIIFWSGVKCRTDEQNAISQKKAESDYFRSSKIIQGYTDPFIPNHSILLVSRVSEFQKIENFEIYFDRVDKKVCGKSGWYKWVKVDGIWLKRRFKTTCSGYCKKQTGRSLLNANES